MFRTADPEPGPQLTRMIGDAGERGRLLWNALFVVNSFKRTHNQLLYNTRKSFEEY